ncbi:Dabb family protein [Aquimarina sp. 2304DJ70-9]|uniref:Dabb family protein n=1 Tax=Aquimarina penaris TaxID=3231044 RepID=UPI003462BD6C
MKHIKFILLVLMYIISLSSVAQIDKGQIPQTEKIKGNFVHTVLFWLNNPDNLKDRKTFEDGVSTLLKQCKFIASSHIGIPADTATRPVVDDSYTYCVVITFTSKEEHDAYQIDPLHTSFVENNKNLWNKVLVYDSVSF